MRIDLGSIAFNAVVESGGNTPSWGTSLGQSAPDYKITYTGAEEIVVAMTHCFYPKENVYCPLGKGGRVYCGADTSEIQQAAVFHKTFINGKSVGRPFILILTIDSSKSHSGRKTIKYSNKIEVKNETGTLLYNNNDFYNEAVKVLGISENASWLVYDISAKNQDELHFSAVVMNAHSPETYTDAAIRKQRWIERIEQIDKSLYFNIEKKVALSLNNEDITDEKLPHLRAMRTKPFLLLAGISGTGKSRIVKDFAFKSCPDHPMLRKDKTSPGNYCLIEVKPNWHDSTELLGYESQIGGKHYTVTPFVKFLAKAMLYPEVPFFVCLDEMNLAPVEQYFAEFLSVLESRKKVDGRITSEPLIPADIFKKYGESLKKEIFSLDKPKCGNSDIDEEELHYGNENMVYDLLKAEGLRIPENLIVIGTVNMDETTHQFSRKVIDRAMTIEMNIEDGDAPFKSFYDEFEELDYTDTPLAKDLFLPMHVQAAEALADMDEEAKVLVKKEIPTLLSELNKALDGTPFKIAYRVQNELTLYFATLLAEAPDANLNNLMITALDNIMMMKVLPRIEGDEDQLKEPLKALAEFTANKNLTASAKKVEEMQTRLGKGHFTSFWP